MSNQLANNFCPACGGNLIVTAIICPNCGSPTTKYVGQAIPKSKTAAVLLSVFLGTWSWLYTYKHNKAKFWITFSIIFLLAAFLIFWAFYMSIRYQQGSWYASEGDLQTGVVVAESLRALCFAFWVWAIIDNSVKPSEWYRIYASK